MDGLREYSPNYDKTEFIAEALELYRGIADFEANVRDEMQEDVSFELVDQWDEKDRVSRERSKRPVLTVDRLNQFLNQVKNEQRQNAPSIKVSPVDDKADIKSAERRQGIIRHIQYQSDAKIAYQNAFDFAVGPGRGFFRIRTDYAGPDTFDQDIIIEAIQDPFTVFIDKNHKKLDYSDANHGFIVDRIPKSIFKKLYPDADEQHWDSGLREDGWIDDDTITVAEFYCKWAKKRKLLQFADGSKMYMDEIDSELRAEAKGDIVNERTVYEPYWMWYKITAYDVLDEKHIPGTYLPIVPVIGTEKRINGELHLYGLTRKAKDPQRMYNFWVCSEAEILSLAPKNPWIGAKGQFEGFEKDWQRSNTEALAFLQYNPVSSNGQLVGPPQRQQPVPPPTGIINAKMGAVEDMKAATGIYDAGLGMKGPEVSGRAILARQREGDTATYHYIDNLSVSITHGGRIINEWLPIYYTPGRIAKIVGEEGEEDQIEIGALDRKSGEILGLGDGKYDVVVSMGASYNTKRQEAAESMMEFIRVMPQTAQLVSDLLVKSMDWPGAEEIAERLKKVLPPNILEQEGGEKQLAMQLQQAMQQLEQNKQIIPQLIQQIEQMQKELQDKTGEMRTDIEVAKINNAGKIQVAQINAQLKAREDDRRFREFLFTNRQPAANPGGQ